MSRRNMNIIERPIHFYVMADCVIGIFLRFSIGPIFSNFHDERKVFFGSLFGSLKYHISFM